jgi:hypothetical protein
VPIGLTVDNPIPPGLTTGRGGVNFLDIEGSPLRTQMLVASASSGGGVLASTEASIAFSVRVRFARFGLDYAKPTCT